MGLFTLQQPKPAYSCLLITGHLPASGCFDLKRTHIDSGYDIAEEVQKFLWADVIIYQMPGWWMGAPWTVKTYIDEVFTAGHGSLYANDGRTRSDASQKYGSGGLIQGKQYMLSLTWNAPQQGFDDPTDFFEGKGVDAVYLPSTRPTSFSACAPCRPSSAST